MLRDAERASWAKVKAASVAAPFEERASEARCAASSGSLPGWCAEAFLWLWERASYYDAEAAKYLCTELAGRAEECRSLANGLHRHMGYANLRQPEENNPAQTPEGQRPGGCL